jgi:plastocyanin
MFKLKIPGRGLIAFASVLAIAAGVRAAGVTVDQSGQRFSEKSLSISKGEIVVFANKDDVSHNITVLDDNDDATDLGLQKPGESLSHAFGKDGTFKIRCSIHPSMKMTVAVK